MTTTELERALQSAATRTFEDLCFVLAEPWPADEAEPQTSAAAAVDFEGVPCGRLELRLSGDSPAVIASYMLGIDDADLALQQDAVGELANVICGNLLPALGGVDAVYRLHAPTGNVAEATSPAAVCLRFRVDAGSAELRLVLEAA